MCVGLTCAGKARCTVDRRTSGWHAHKSIQMRLNEPSTVKLVMSRGRDLGLHIVSVLCKLLDASSTGFGVSLCLPYACAGWGEQRVSGSTPLGHAFQEDVRTHS